MSGYLYQPFCKTELPKGTPVMINGPWDTYGTVLGAKEKKEDGVFVLSVRGQGKTKKYPSYNTSLYWKG